MAAPLPSPTKKWHTKVYDAISPTRPQNSAKGKTVVVSGGGSGIGPETARYFAQAGASRIGILGRREKALLDTKASIEGTYPGVEVVIAPTDISKREEVEAAFVKFAAACAAGAAGGGHKIDVFVSSAATVGPMVNIKDVNADKFLEAIHVNIGGALYLAQAFLRYAADDAVVIEINSSAAHLNYTAGFGAYNTYKLAVFRFWDSLAVEHPDMSFYHIQPGVVRTAMNDEAGGIEAVGFEDDSKQSLLLKSS
jgi:NAD(P)-dependent dehydrogenase (short-subunit alcohol dehydrogenase family)